jgi:ATP-dependent Clp protease ATP-binding subunit ClpA
VGFDQGGLLTDAVDQHPHAVVLLDEIEKANPSILNLFLQAFDEGWITDGRGRRAYLSDAVVIMTSNLGAHHFRKLSSPLGFGDQQEQNIKDVRGDVMRELERRLSPEFRNRLDEVIVFSPLTAEEVSRIARIQLDKLAATVMARGKRLDVTPAAMDGLVREGHSLAFGARFLKRVIDDRVKIPLSEIWNTAERFSVDMVDGAITVTAATAEAAEQQAPLAAV